MELRLRISEVTLYRTPMPRVLRGSNGGGCFLMGEILLYSGRMGLRGVAFLPVKHLFRLWIS